MYECAGMRTTRSQVQPTYSSEDANTSEDSSDNSQASASDDGSNAEDTPVPEASSPHHVSRLESASRDLLSCKPHMRHNVFVAFLHFIACCFGVLVDCVSAALRL